MMVRPLRMLVALVLALGVASPAAAAPRARAGDPDAEYVRTVVGRAAAHVDAGRYAEALAVLDEAERTRPHAVFVYVRATIEERRGDCERASQLYERFLELDVPDSDAEDARRGIERCRGSSPAEPDPPVAAEPSPPSSETPALDPGPPDGPPPRPWITDPWGGVLAATGLVGMGVGVGLVARSRADARASTTAATLQDFDELSRRAVRLDTAGIVTLGVGSALLLAGVVRYALVATRPRRRPSRLPPTAGLTLRF